MNKVRKINIVVFVAGLLSVSHFGGCSHSNPYFRSDISESVVMDPPDPVLLERIILIGDAGGTVDQDPLLSSLSQWCLKDPSKTHVFFLGDNIYPRGLDEDDPQALQSAEKYLNAQLNVIKSSGVKATFIPGNHDWGRGEDRGRKAILKQEQMVNNTLKSENAFLPGAACPGPAFLDLKSLRIIIFDSNFWINDKIEWSENCPFGNEQEFLSSLRQLFQTDDDRPVFILTHHPLDSHGPHGGFYDWQDHLFPLTRLVNWFYLPLPIVGSLYPLSRTYLVKNDQDFVGSNYKQYVRELTKLLQEEKPLLYASGHEHSLEVLEGEAVRYHLVSGAGSIPKITPVTDSANTLFAHSHAGFMVLNVMEEGQIVLQVVEPPEGAVVFQTILHNQSAD